MKEKSHKKESSLRRSCVDCGITGCSYDGPYSGFCLTASLSEEERQKVMEVYKKPENQKIMKVSSLVEVQGYLEQTRVEEIIEFAGKIKAKKIGIATCVGLLRESATAAEIFRKRGFQVFGVACKVGAIKKVQLGIDPVCNKTGENACNPIMQAKILEREETDLNVVIGLCVGHDSLFYKYSKALTTTLITKDRVLGHNPAAALYTADSYYKKLFQRD